MEMIRTQHRHEVNFLYEVKNNTDHMTHMTERNSLYQPYFPLFHRSTSNLITQIMSIGTEMTISHQITLSALGEYW